jgi:hypothetical protein
MTELNELFQEIADIRAKFYDKVIAPEELADRNPSDSVTDISGLEPDV